MSLLAEKSRFALDWPDVLKALARHARSLRGQEIAAQGRLFDTPSECRDALAAVSELEVLEELGDRMPTGGLVDVRDAIETAHRGRILDLQELSECADGVANLSRLARWIQKRAEQAPILSQKLSLLFPPDALRRTLIDSFESPGVLSERHYPELRRIRQEIASAQAHIQRTMDSLLRDPKITALLQDRFITHRGDRAVLPIRASAKRSGLGIVHDSSASGETVFIEPTEVVELHNKKRLAEAALAREETRIRTLLSRDLGNHAPEILRGFEAGWELDLVAARLGLGLQLNGRVPEVGETGTIDLHHARHPLLALSLPEVIPNDLNLNDTHPGLILSGPNAGGKTVALKTMALAALFVRAAIPFPCKASSRIDFFSTIIADIGDSQDLSDGLSTFSAHMKTLQSCLESASSSALIVLDELAVGTDPTQGAALARVVLQELVNRGARVVTTTHYAELKGLPAIDRRFRAGAVAFANGRPTYTLNMGEVGLSHAFAIAQKMGLSAELIDRARQALSEHERQWVEQSEQLVQERSHLKSTQQELAQERRRLKEAEALFREKTTRLKTHRTEILEAERKRSRERFKAAEQDIKKLIADLQANPSLRNAGEALRVLREEHPPPQTEPTVVPRPPSKPLRPGDTVRVRSLGKTGIVCGLPRAGKVEVQIGPIKTQVSLQDCESATPKRAEKTPQLAFSSRSTTLSSTLRTDSNTVDLRGCRVDEAIQKVDFFLDGMIQRGQSTAYILHGHGTGALKKAIREWLPSLPSIEAWRPAKDSEGGDAFTLVNLR